MTKRTIATELIRVVPAPEGNQHVLQFRMPSGEMGELAFPSEQLDSLIEASLQADRNYAELGDGARTTPTTLLAESFQLGLRLPSQMVLIDFRVGNRTFAFALLREHAQRLMTLMREVLPAH